MLDTLQISFWSLTYIIIIFWGIKYKKEYPILMPLVAGSLNLAWELNALIISHGFWGHILWIVLDIVIFFLNIRNLKFQIWKILYCIATVTCAISLWFIFRLDMGMRISVFTIDFFMAIEYLVASKFISYRGKIVIACTKLIGDLFAWLCYYKSLKFVAIIGLVVFTINIFYLIIAIFSIKTRQKNKEYIE